VAEKNKPIVSILKQPERIEVLNLAYLESLI
jgi:hypothetical protein